MPTSRRRLHRLGTTFLVVLSLVFAQLALARYVCPQQADVQAMADMMAAGAPCAGLDPEQPVLCHQHTADPGKAFESLQLTTVAQPAAVQILALPVVVETAAASAVDSTATAEAQPPPDPLFLVTLRLRV